MEKLRFAGDKPKDCKHCYWWGGRKGCDLGGEENCYYRLPELPERIRKSECEGCAYKTPGLPCVGYCLRSILTDHREGYGNAGR